MKNHYSIYDDYSFVNNIDIFDLLKLKEIGLNDRELAKELKIPKSYLTQLYREYDIELQGD